MFRTNISSPIEPITVEYTNTLHRLYNEPDYSLTCLGIVLLKSRTEYSGIDGKYWIASNLKDCYNVFTTDVKAVEHKPYFGYYMYSSMMEETIEDEDRKMLEAGYKRKNTIEKLIADKSGNKCIVYYNEENLTAAVFINTRDIRLYHLLISFVSLYFPKLFEEKSLTPEEYEVVKSLSKNDSSVFVNKTKEAMAPFTEELRRIQLRGLINNMHEAKISGAKHNVDTQRITVNDYYRNYLAAVEELKNYIVLYEGLKVTEEAGESEKELVEYLVTNKDIHKIEIENNVISFIATSLLTNYNEDAWRLFDERDGIFDGDYHQRDFGLTLCEVFKDRTNRKKLLNSIFGENAEFAVKMCGYYKLNLHNNGVSTRSRYNYTSVDETYKSYLPNPHLQIHSCLGGYTSRITTMLEQGNYITAFEMCIASAGSVNLDETDLTFRPFLGFILSSKEKILRRKDGVDMSPEEALIYLIDKEKENEAD